MKEPNWKERDDVVRKARSFLAPRSSGILGVQQMLLTSTNNVVAFISDMAKGTVPEGCRVLKEKYSKTTERFMA